MFGMGIKHRITAWRAGGLTFAVVSYADHHINYINFIKLLSNIQNAYILEICRCVKLNVQNTIK